MTTGSELAGRVALVTGGTGGVGAAIAERLVAAGARVAIGGRLPPEPQPAGMTTFAADVRDAGAVADLVSAVVDHHGRLDVLVNSLGGSPAAASATAAPESSTEIVTLNLLAPLFVAQAVNRVMQAQDGGGAIVNLGSMTGRGPSPGTAAYGAAKAGLVDLTRSLAVEWAPKVRVNCVSADLHAGAGEAATVPLGRPGTPSEVADAVVFLASPAASYVTGAHLVVHGGGERPAFLAAVAGDPGP